MTVPALGVALPPPPSGRLLGALGPEPLLSPPLPFTLISSALLEALLRMSLVRALRVALAQAL